MFFISILLFISQIHPFSLSLLLISLSLALILNLFTFSEHWLGFVVMLIYLGGILIIFVYTRSILPNIKLILFGHGKWIIISFIIAAIVPISLVINTYLETLSQVFLEILGINWNSSIIFLIFLLSTLVVSIEFSWQKTNPLRIN